MANPPAFGSQDYWDARFASNSNPFEWLLPPDALDPYFREALAVATDPNPQTLHIGCGTSLLSQHLRSHVRHPERIHNLDYSQVAVDIGRKRERDFPAVEQEDGQEPTKYMRWSAADLLGHSSLLRVCDPGTYSVIVDKSTSDSIACADDIEVPLPYPVSMFPDRLDSQLLESPKPVDPLHVLAVHMALLAMPKARWLCLSYSTDRYPFLRGPCAGSRDDIRENNTGEATKQRTNNDGVFPDPAKLWRIVQRDELEVLQKEGESGSNPTHRPKIVDWMYVLERTDVPLHVHRS